MPVASGLFEIAIRKKMEHDISAELHDHISPSLTAAKLLLDYCLQDINQHSVELKKVSEILKDLINEVRNLSHSIEKKADRDFELKDTLSSLVENFKKGCGLRIVLKYDKRLELLLKNNQKVHLIRIVQEQLQNISKHAAASKILITLQAGNGQAVLMTRDNGKGFDPENHRDGLGITNMLQRVNELGGHIHINSRNGEGTYIKIYVPMDESK